MSSSIHTLNPTELQTEFFQSIRTALYHADAMWGDAAVELYLRGLPHDHGFIIVAGTQEAIESVLSLRFTEADLDWIGAQPMHKHLGHTLLRVFVTFDLPVMFVP